jgi:hypothetical protein
MGFSNWRMATKNEAQKMFLGWSGGSIDQWAIAQGYPKDFLNSKVVMFLTNHVSFKYDKTDTCWQLSMTNGIPTLIKCNWPGGTGGKMASYKCQMLESINAPKGHLIPVRQPADGEIYFY